MKWGLPAGQFDAIVSIATLHHVPLEPLLPKLQVALKPGGRLIILDLLQQANATVTVCHSKTKELAQFTKNADILVDFFVFNNNN